MEVGTTDQIFDGPHHPYTEALLSAVPSVDGEPSRRIRLSGEIPSPANPPAGCVFHTRCHRFIAGHVRRDRAARGRGGARAHASAATSPSRSSAARHVAELDAVMPHVDRRSHRPAVGQRADRAHGVESRRRRRSSAARSRPTSCVGEEGLALIEANADQLLAEVGIEIHDDVAAAAVPRRRRHGRRRAGALRPRPRARAVRDGAVVVHPASPATRPARSRSAATPSCSPRPTARRSCATSPADAATARWPTSRTSSSWPTARRGCTTRAARCASRSTCRSTSGTSTWCTPTCATATRR